MCRPARRLEGEAQRNLEMPWLTGRLAPDFKTIADFRRDNSPAIKATCRQFVLLCRKLDLFSDSLVAIDGSKFKAVNARDKTYSQSVIQRRMEQVEASVARYLAALDTADRHDPGVPNGQSPAPAGRSSTGCASRCDTRARWRRSSQPRQSARSR